MTTEFAEVARLGSDDIAAGMDEVVGLLSIPTVAMMAGSMAVFKYQPGPKLIAACQHFASGILVGAVGFELAPEVEVATSLEMVALVVGFFLGVACLLFVGRYDFRHWKMCSQGNTLRENDSLISDEEVGASPAKKVKEYDSVNSEISHLEKNQFPMGLIFAVLVDGTIDGLLIGIASLSSVGTGLVTAIALALEMALLGVSTCNTLRKTDLPLSSVIFLCFTLPFAILIGGLIGASVLHGVTGALLLGTTAFGGAGLLYLVTEELMIEAHENEETDRWFVTVMFFVGFMAVVLLDKFLPEFL